MITNVEQIRPKLVGALFKLMTRIRPKKSIFLGKN